MFFLYFYSYSGVLEIVFDDVLDHIKKCFGSLAEHIISFPYKYIMINKRRIKWTKTYPRIKILWKHILGSQKISDFIIYKRKRTPTQYIISCNNI